MAKKIEKTVELPGSDEVLWNEDGSWNLNLLEKLLEEASVMNLREGDKILVTYLEFRDNPGIAKSTKYKTFGDLKDNYFLWEDKEYVSKSNLVEQNI